MLQLSTGVSGVGVMQDIDSEQQDFLARLASQGSITAVGDDDQRIYAWRDKGASAPEVGCLVALMILDARRGKTCKT